MRTCLANLLFLATLATANAQLNPLPLPSSDDGAVITRFSSQSDLQTGWATSALHDYRVSNDNTFTTPPSGGADAYGRTWGTTAPDFASINSGGSFRVILLGAGSPWLIALGYTYDHVPSAANSFAMSDVTGDFAPADFSFGDSTDISLLPGEGNQFDLWADTTSNVYAVFNPGNSSTNSAATGEVLWTQAPLLVPTYLSTLGGLADINTWIGSIVETSASGSSQEYRFAVQEYVVSGTPLGGDPATPVPEAGTYAWLGVASLAGLILARRFKR